MDFLFIHGAGGWLDDQPLAEELRTRLGVPVAMARYPEEDMSAAAWFAELDRQRDALGPDLAIIGHSFGASMALLRLGGGWHGPLPRGLVLLATPFWGSEGWQAEYALPAGYELPAGLPLYLHHCRDDDTVPVDHLDRLAALLPGAVVRRHETGGHQFAGQMAAVADDVGLLIS
ncbi:alpha/beta hydrolase [Arthrobacter sp. Sa2BUA2]|uniref:Alpha/beta hydrolase n=1 Tax=Arthrobacter pullicola TaxID=2762224 RepID=A0ABR8YL33_9MICC|nr:alpha/beta fold hydrolase [Arthrobacter pullicola]MBD8044928.1 alpha/beta hydrolase [Arthrobacter pullicola]